MTVGARLGVKARGRRSRRGDRDSDDRVSILPGEEEEAAEGNAGARAAAPRAAAREEEEEGAAGRRVRFALLPEPYEPLRPPGKRPHARRLKKYGKNVGKALRKGCRYLVVGLQGLATAYSAPFGVAAQVASFVR